MRHATWISTITRRRFAVVCTLTIFLGLGGCGNREMCKVQGTVKFKDGTPLTRGVVHFEGPRYAAHGTIQPDGCYVMSSQAEGDGVAPGTYRIFIDNTEEPMVWVPEKQTYRYGQPQIPAKYAAAATSGLTFDVPGNGVFDIQLDAPAPANLSSAR